MDKEYTIECPKCGQLVVGDEPRIVIECDNCREVDVNED